VLVPAVQIQLCNLAIFLLFIFFACDGGLVAVQFD